MSNLVNFYNDYRYLVVPFFTWIGIQLFKIIWEYAETKRLNIRRLWGAGGMPSAHSAVVVSITTMIARSQGFSSPLFALSFVFSMVVLYDACDVRYETGKQAHVLNEIMTNPDSELSKMTFNVKLEELVGHTPFQVFVGAIVGLIVGLIF